MQTAVHRRLDEQLGNPERGGLDQQTVDPAIGQVAHELLRHTSVRGNERHDAARMRLERVDVIEELPADEVRVQQRNAAAPREDGRLELVPLLDGEYGVLLAACALHRVDQLDVDREHEEIRAARGQQLFQRLRRQRVVEEATVGRHYRPRVTTTRRRARRAADRPVLVLGRHPALECYRTPRQGSAVTTVNSRGRAV